MTVVLTCSVSFLGFQMHDYEPKRALLRDNAENYLKMLNKEHFLEHFDCFYNLMVYILILTPLVIVAPRLKVSALFSSFVMKMLAVLMYLDLNDIVGTLRNEECMKMIVVSCGLFCLFCKSGNQVKREVKVKTQ